MSMPSHGPATMADTTAPWRQRLKARGYDPDHPPSTEGAPVREKETPEEKAQRLARRQESFQARWLERVPVMYATAALEDLEETQGAPTIQGWLQSGSLNLILAGPVGTGKTHAAYAVGNRALATGRWTEAWTTGDLMDAMRPGATDHHGAERRARHAQVLILDDLPAKATDWEAERLTLILDARVRDQLQTVVTTNATAAQLAEAWGPRVMDRLRYRMTSVTFRGESRRGGDW